MKLNSINNQWSECVNNKLGVVDYSTPKKVGKLNQQLICLLSANVPSKTLLELQQSHLDFVRHCWYDPFALGYVVAMEGGGNSRKRVWDMFQEFTLDYFVRDNIGSAARSW